MYAAELDVILDHSGDHFNGTVGNTDITTAICAAEPGFPVVNWIRLAASAWIVKVKHADCHGEVVVVTRIPGIRLTDVIQPIRRIRNAG